MTDDFPTDDFQVMVARLALAAARPYGFALAGGNALILHGVIHRNTEDVDLFTDRADGVRAASVAVAATLRAAGLDVTEADESSGLGELFEGFDLVEFEVSGDERYTTLQLVHFDRRHTPIEHDGVGPVLHLDDLVATKVAALAARAELRDFIDVAAILRRYPRSELIALATQADAALSEEELAAAMRRLDRADDGDFTAFYGLTPPEVAAVRAAFADWPRA